VTGPAFPADAYVLREMRWWDIDAVYALEEELFPEDAWSRAMYWSELADTRHPDARRHYVVAEAPDGTVAGYAGLAVVARVGDVQTIGVGGRHQGAGLGARLLGELLRRATALECHEVLLEVRVDNHRAQRLYTRFGFERIGRRRGYYQPGNVDAYVMRLSLDPADPADPADRAPGAGPRPAPQPFGFAPAAPAAPAARAGRARTSQNDPAAGAAAHPPAEGTRDHG
jgi:ribosomal-protein-alanine N-acetyltransferase